MTHPLVERWILGASNWGEAPPELIALAESYRRQALSPKTLDRYETSLREWFAFCERRQVEPLPASDLAVCAMVAELADRGNAIGTIRNWLSTLNALHLSHGYARPGGGRLRAVLRGVARQGSARQKQPLTREPVMEMVRHARRGRRKLIALRDAAILLIFHASAIRFIELARMLLEQLTFRSNGLTIYLPRSKGDPWGEGQYVEVEAASNPKECPVGALRAWLQAAGIESGVVFRRVRYTGLGPNGKATVPDRPLSHATINGLVKDYVTRVGLDPADYSTRSLRSGFATTAWRDGRTLIGINRKMRHKHWQTTADYIKDASPYERNITRVLGL